MDHSEDRGAGKLLRCTDCTRTFNRPSHLNRHRLTHLPPSQRRTIHCSHCDRSFSRQDVLLRHLRASHDIPIDNTGTNQKSCHRCVRHKLKCDRVMPCGSCHSARVSESCSYPHEKSPDGNGRHHARNGQDVHRNGFSDNSNPGMAMSNVAVDFNRYDEAAPKEMGSYGMQPSSGFTDFNQPFEPIMMDDGCSPTFDNGNTPSDGNGTVISQSLDAMAMPFDFRGSGFDWLDFDISNIDLTLDNTGAMEPPMHQQNASFNAQPPPEAVPSLPSLKPRTNVLPWPFEQGKESRPSRFTLPRLHDVLQATRSNGGGQQTAVDCLVQLLSEQQLPSSKQLATSNLAPGVDLLNQLIDSYFIGFQIIQPIMHAPTWNVGECPTMLLTAMTCIGSVLSNDPIAMEVSDSIGEFCSAMITWLGLSDSGNYSNISYLAALCLHQIYSLGSGNRQLYQNADRTRGVLIGSLRGLGLLSPRLNLQGESAEGNAAVETSNDPYTEWLTWATREREIRIAWASFEYDCSLCTLTNRRGAVDLSELPARLPCSESLWEAPSAQAWIALKARSPSKAQGAHLSGVLRAALSGRRLGEHVSMWGRRLCGQVIGRLLWDLKQLEALSTSEYFDLPSLFKAHQHSKTSLLRGLDSLLDSMEQPCSTSDLVSYNISSLLCHYSHMYAADDVMDMILYIVRKVVSQGPDDDKGLVVARKRLTTAMKADRKRTRRLLWHAGQIVAVANEFLVSAPCEIMRLFMAYIFILSYAKYCPPSSKIAQGISVRLDLSSRQAEQRKAISEWVQMGGPAQIGSAADIYAKGATALITKDAQNIFQRLRTWGLAEKFARILQCFENNIS